MNNINTVFKILSDWFKQNLLSLNFTKTEFTSCRTKNNNQIEILIMIVNLLLLLHNISWFNCWLLSNMVKPYWFADKKIKRYMLLKLKH
jgi:hypothetical protein